VSATPQASAAEPAPDAWDSALVAAACLAVAPADLGGICLRGRPGPARDAWLRQLRGMIGQQLPWRRMPAGIDDERLLGSIDVAASLEAGQVVRQSGLLQLADGGILQIGMVERLPLALAARIAMVMDSGEVRVERGGHSDRCAARFGVVAFDESLPDEEGPPRVLLEHLAFRIELDGVAMQSLDAEVPWDARQIQGARERWRTVTVDDAGLESLTAAAWALGVDSPRATLLAVRVARVLAALADRAAVEPEHLRVAAALVLAPRATRVPPPAPEQTEPESEDEAPAEPPTRGEPEQGAAQQREGAEAAQAEPEPGPDDPLPDQVLAAARAAIPPGLLAGLTQTPSAGRAAGGSGRSGLLRLSKRRGRPCGTRRSTAIAGQRLSLVETLRAAAPWQRLRQQEPGRAGRGNARIDVRREDFHIRRYQDRTETTTIMLVDASGSAALHRLAEVKGAVELLLADCYVRRDRVAVIAFRGRGAELLLAPTRSLLRARRSLAGLPGGGATPLAAGLDAGFLLAEQVRREGRMPMLVVFTDGRANFTRAGAMDRERAHQEAIESARRWRQAQLRAVLVDSSPRPQPQALQIAEAIGARYVPLPHADATRIADVAGQLRTGGGRS
jgi:magnesium chelatase subunit D